LPADIIIKKINVTDAALLSTVALKAYDDHYQHLWYDNGEWYRLRCFTKEILAAELADNNNLFFFAYLDDEPVGFLKLRIDAALETETAKEAMELERIYLTKAVSGKGVGKALMQLTDAIAKDYNKHFIWLKAMDTSEGPIAFYKKMGYETCGTYRLNFEQMKEELSGMVIMKKEVR
jgi:diamine N-acetyltransferase